MDYGDNNDHHRSSAADVQQRCPPSSAESDGLCVFATKLAFLCFSVLLRFKTHFPPLLSPTYSPSFSTSLPPFVESDTHSFSPCGVCRDSRDPVCPRSCLPLLSSFRPLPRILIYCLPFPSPIDYHRKFMDPPCSQLINNPQTSRKNERTPLECHREGGNES